MFKKIAFGIGLVLIGVTTSQAQIFIDTGHPDVDKYKQETGKTDRTDTYQQGSTHNEVKHSHTERMGSERRSYGTSYGSSGATSTPAQDNSNINKYGDEKKGDAVYIKTGHPEYDSYKSGAVEAESNVAVDVAGDVSGTIGTIHPESRRVKGDMSSANPALNTLGISEADVPPYAQPGKCYARCIIPAQYETRQEQVVDQPASVRTEVIPAEYQTIYDTVIITPARTYVEDIPAEYDFVEEEIMVEPPKTEWKLGEADANCLSDDPKDCQVMCLVEIPARYETVRKKVMISPATSKEITVPAETKVVSRRVLVSDAYTTEVEVPATFKTVSRKIAVSGGGYQEWREVLCSNKVTSSKIRSIQNALKKRGYNPGPSDNVLGPKTKQALRQYQADNQLPVGNLNMETLQALGVDY